MRLGYNIISGFGLLVLRKGALKQVSIRCGFLYFRWSAFGVLSTLGWSDDLDLGPSPILSQCIYLSLGSSFIRSGPFLSL